MGASAAPLSMEIKDTVNRIKLMLSSVETITKEAFEKEADLMSDLNRDQLLSGVDAEGKSMPSYVSNSKKRGKINLKDTGDYHQGFKPDFMDEGIRMISTDRKLAFLDPKYDTALGLNENSSNILVERVIPVVQTELKKL